MSIAVTPSDARDLPVPAQRTKPGKVLVVDDEELLVEIAVACIEAMGHTALHAADAATALEIIRRDPDIALVMTDVMMPGLSGLDLVHTIHLERPAIKIIFTSGLAPEVIAQRAGVSACDLILRKPYKLTDLHAMIHKTFEPDNDGARALAI